MLARLRKAHSDRNGDGRSHKYSQIGPTRVRYSGKVKRYLMTKKLHSKQMRHTKYANEFKGSPGETKMSVLDYFYPEKSRQILCVGE